MLRAAFALVAVCVGLSFVAAQLPKAGKAAVTMDDIKKAWQERQDKVKTLKMSWKRVVVKPKGSLDFARTFMAASGMDRPAPQPPKDLRCSGEALLVLSGDRFRYECHADTWSISTQSLKHTRSVAILDAGEYKTTNKHEGDSSHDILVTEPVERSSIQFEMIELKPVWWCVRGTRNALGNNSLDQFEVSGRNVTISGISCVELEKKSRTADTSTRLLVRHRDYLPVRYTITSGNREVLQLQLKYDKKFTVPFIPASWRYTYSGRSGITEESVEVDVTRCEVDVTRCEVGTDVTDETFKFSKTPGTVLTDLRKGQVARVMPDGSTSRSVPMLSVQRYEELVAATSPRVNRWWWLAGALASLVAIVVTYVVVKRSRKGAGGTGR